MSMEIITAVYEKGLLRPTQPLDLREHQTVRLQLLPDESDEREQVLAALGAAGMMHARPKDGPTPPDPVSPAERRELARILGRAQGRSLSEIVLDERGPR